MTKKAINKIFALAIISIMAGLTACSNDEGHDVSDNGVKVVASPAELAWKGGSTRVKVDKTVATAYSDAAWLTVDVADDSVNINATANYGRESRNARLVVKASATDSTIVSVSQQGIVFNAESATDLTLTDEAMSTVIPITSNGEVTIEQCPDWITATVTDEGVSIEVSENTTGHFRGGSVVFGIGEMTKEVNVVQYEVERDVLGSYYVVHYEDDEPVFALKVNLETDRINFQPSGVFSRYILGTFDESDLTFSLTNGQLLGKYNDYYIYSIIITNDEKYTLDTSATGTFTFTYSKVYGDFVGELGGAFDDEGRTASMIGLFAFSARGLSTSFFKGYIGFFEVMLKASSEEDALAKAHTLSEIRTLSILER